MGYKDLYESGELEKRVNKFLNILKSCVLCPHMCKVDRTKGEKGLCDSGMDVVISSHGSHHGEEPAISGKQGSGAIFFTGCNLKCSFCQNFQISHEYQGKKISVKELADIMIDLQTQGCHNINFVTPTHFLPQILEALLQACEQGLNIPLVYNTNGYDRVEILKLLDQIIDIYLPDIKYSDETSAKKCSGVEDYVKHNRPALEEMFKQGGVLIKDDKGIAKRGMIVRHLVLPNKLAGSKLSLDFIAKELSEDIHVGIMAQYHPCYKAKDDEMLNRRVNRQEYAESVDYAESLGMDNCLVQELASADDFVPDFNKDEPFE